MNIVNSLLNMNLTAGREGHGIRNIVLHTMVGTVSGIDTQFRNPTSQMSVHYGVGLSGDITYWVLESDTALQTDNGQVNLQSIGIGHEDNAIPGDGVRSDAMYNASAELIADLCKRYDIPRKLVEVDGNHTPIESGIVLHWQVSLTQTQCPNGLDSNRIIRQAQAILEPPEEPKPVVYEALPAPKKLRVKDMANGGAEAWDLTFRAWEDVKSVQHLNAGDEFDAIAVAHHPLGGKYYMTAYDYNNSGQSDVPYRPWGANVDDLEEYPVESPTPNPEPQVATEPALAPEVTPAPNPEPTPTPEVTAAQESASEPEPDPQPAAEPSVEETSEAALPETVVSEPTHSAPQIAYSELDVPEDFVTSKAPTSVYDLDTETFAKITAVKELAEGTPFQAVSKAMVVDGSETTYYYVDGQNQAINEDDLQAASTPQEETTAVEDVEPPEPDPRATQEAFSENEGPVPVSVLPPNPDKWMKSYEDLDEPFKAQPNADYEIADLQDSSHTVPLKKLLKDGQPNIINIVGTFEDKDGQQYFLSENCAYPKDKEGNALPRRWLGINPVYLDEDVDSLSNQAIEASKKEKVIAGTATVAGLITRVFMKPKKG